METIFANLIRNVTGCEFTYKDSIYRSKTEVWFMDASFDGKNYRVVSIGEEGLVKLFKKHPLDQKEIPTHVLKFIVV